MGNWSDPLQISEDLIGKETEIESVFEEGMVSIRNPIKNRSLRIKIKVPKMDKRRDEGDDDQIRDDVSGDEEKNLISEIRTDVQFDNPTVCEEDETKNAISEGISKACSVCRKTFLSDKALYGHMRCHPERDWRGIRPPSTAKNISSLSCENGPIGRPKRKVRSTFDPAWLVPNKPMIKRRPPKIARPVVDRLDHSQDSLSDAVHNLMMLASGEPLEHALDKKMKIGEEPKDGVMDSRSTSKKAKSDISLDSGKTESFCDEKQNTEELEIRKMKKNRPREKFSYKTKFSDGKRKKRKTRALQAVHDFHSFDQKKKSMAIVSRYRCNACDKSFPSYQALGGHRASHRKGKVEADPLLASDTASLKTEMNRCRCKICNKTFQSGQALGGHQRCHSGAQAEDSTSSLTSQEDMVKVGHHQPPQEDAEMIGHRAVLDIDLNELPIVEDY